LRRLGVLSGLVFLVLSTGEAFGCVCMFEPNITPERIKAQRLEAFEKATVVFLGEVVWLDRLTIKFKVDRIWKGPEAEDITMQTGTKDNGDGTFTSSSCDYGFSRGQNYLVYAYGPANELKTHACSRTALLKYAEEEMKALDEITPHKSPKAEPRPSQTNLQIRTKSNKRLERTRR